MLASLVTHESRDGLTRPAVDRATALAIPPGPLVRTLVRIVDAWGLDREQTMALAGIDSASVWTRWKRDPDAAKLKLLVIERLSHVLAIYSALHRLFGHEFADDWVRQANTHPLFGGAAPIDRMTGFTTDLVDVRRYLDAEANR